MAHAHARTNNFSCYCQWGHGYSEGFKLGAFLRTLIIKRPWIHGGLELCFVHFFFSFKFNKSGFVVCYTVLVLIKTNWFESDFRPHNATLIPKLAALAVLIVFNYFLFHNSRYIIQLNCLANEYFMDHIMVSGSAYLIFVWRILNFYLN